MIHDTWYMIHDTWYMIHYTWYILIFFSKKISFISIKKNAIGLQNVHKKLFYTKEVVKARTRGDDISISVLERRLWTKATSSIIAIIFSCSWEQPSKSLTYCDILPAQLPISSPIIPTIYLHLPIKIFNTHLCLILLSYFLMFNMKSPHHDNLTQSNA